VCYLYICLYFQFQFNPGVLPFFPSQFLPKDMQRDMLQPFSDRFSTVDESLTDWNPLDYNPLWTQGPQSPFSHVTDKDVELQPSGVAENWSGMAGVDSQCRGTVENSQRDQPTSGRLSEQVCITVLVTKVKR